MKLRYIDYTESGEYHGSWFSMGVYTLIYSLVGTYYYTYGIAPSSQSSMIFSGLVWPSIDNTLCTSSSPKTFDLSSGEGVSTGTGLPDPSRETKFSGTNRNREIFIFPVQLTTSRIGNLTRLITLAICDDHPSILHVHTELAKRNKIVIQNPKCKDHNTTISIIVASKAKWAGSFLLSPRFLADMFAFSFLLRVVVSR